MRLAARRRECNCLWRIRISPSEPILRKVSHSSTLLFGAKHEVCLIVQSRLRCSISINVVHIESILRRISLSIVEYSSPGRRDRVELTLLQAFLWRQLCF